MNIKKPETMKFDIERQVLFLLNTESKLSNMMKKFIVEDYELISEVSVIESINVKNKTLTSFLLIRTVYILLFILNSMGCTILDNLDTKFETNIFFYRNLIRYLGLRIETMAKNNQSMYFCF